MVRTIREWLDRVVAARQSTVEMVMGLQGEGVRVELNRQLQRPVAAVPFVATFFFENGTETTIWFQVMGHQASSDIVITNMQTSPDHERRNGFGSRAVQTLLNWAMANRLREIRATQAALKNTEGFWAKNGFVPCPRENTRSDYVRR